MDVNLLGQQLAWNGRQIAAWAAYFTVMLTLQGGSLAGQEATNLPL